MSESDPMSAANYEDDQERITAYMMRSVPYKKTNCALQVIEESTSVNENSLRWAEMSDNDPISAENHIENQEGLTTYMLRNVPCKVTKHAMEVELIQRGFHGTYDFVHFPTRRNKSGLGYGFVNFTHADYAAQFKEVFEGYVFAWTDSVKRCRVSPADLQGLEANLKQFRNYSR
eukprot:TRINITY_DN10073_c0_g3_i1.p1 TRINITY_DN10073_c0_g3~~TRINITY_DN10073_c0_g3_i1.p1  ORF type:complete len:174 (+),score=31.38 TRINITY_DN10073_c0_g3_i1:360-881(+)